MFCFLTRPSQLETFILTLKIGWRNHNKHIQQQNQEFIKTFVHLFIQTFGKTCWSNVLNAGIMLEELCFIQNFSGWGVAFFEQLLFTLVLDAVQLEGVLLLLFYFLTVLMMWNCGNKPYNLEHLPDIIPAFTKFRKLGYELWQHLIFLWDK